MKKTLSWILCILLVISIFLNIFLCFRLSKERKNINNASLNQFTNMTIEIVNTLDVILSSDDDTIDESTLVWLCRSFVSLQSIIDANPYIYPHTRYFYKIGALFIDSGEGTLDDDQLIDSEKQYFKELKESLEHLSADVIKVKIVGFRTVFRYDIDIFNHNLQTFDDTFAHKTNSPLRLIGAT